MMPVITAIALESLIHPRSSRDSLSKKPSPPGSREEVEESLDTEDGRKEPLTQRFYYSPALYVTPEPAPIPDISSMISSPTTYVVNYKRRDGRGGCWGGGFDERKKDVCVGRGDENASSGVVGEEKNGEEEEAMVGDSRGVTEIEEAEVIELEDDYFFDPLDSMSLGSNRDEVDDGSSLQFHGCGSQLSVYNKSQSEFYDTVEEFFSDASLSSSFPSLSSSCEKELHALRVSFLEEANRKKQAEETLLSMNRQWEKVVQCLFQFGPFPEIQKPEHLTVGIDPAQICQEIVFLKFVSENLERDLSKEDAKEAMMKVITSKNYEISRVRDRMQYYEAMNREMCQRNQEAVDLARKRRQRDRKRKWIWSCVGLSLTVGASLFAYSYLPHRGEDLPSAPCSETFHSCTSK